MTPKQKRFINEYLVDLNATQAAIRTGYSKKTARTIAADLLANPNIEITLREAQEDLAKRTQVTQEQIIGELKKIAFSRLDDFIEWGPDGIALKSSNLVAHQSASIADISTRGAEGGLRIRLHDKLKALELLGRHLGLFKDKVEVGIRPVFIFGEESTDNMK